MGTEVSSSRFNKQDFRAYEERLAMETALLEKWFSNDVFKEEHPKGGFELEAWLIDQNCLPAPFNEQFLDLSGDLLVVPELAKFNVEINGKPLTLAGNALGQMADELQQTWRRCGAVATTLNSTLLMIGALPTVRDKDLSLKNMSNMTRFRALNEQVLRLRKGSPIGLDIQGRQHLRTAHYDVMLEAAATSFQIHLQISAGMAKRVYNAAHIISAPLVAVSANTPYLFGKDLWDETRIPLFEQAIGVGGYDSPECGAEQRVSFGTGYVQESLLECYRKNLSCFPILLPACEDCPLEELAHLRLHNGTIWRWNRPLVGFDAQNRPHLRIEHRVVPAGPTITDCLANASFFYGLVYALALQPVPPETLLNFSDARRNFYAAAKNGLRARIRWLHGKRVPIQQLMLEKLLPLAHQGLQVLGIDPLQRDYYLDIIEQRLRSGQNGADWQRRYIEKYHCDMRALTAAYRERQDAGLPVHQWTL